MRELPAGRERKAVGGPNKCAETIVVFVVRTFVIISGQLGWAKNWILRDNSSKVWQNFCKVRCAHLFEEGAVFSNALPTR